MKLDAEQTGIDASVRWWNSIPAKLVSGLLLLTLVAGATVWSVVAKQQENLFLEQRIHEAGITSSIISRDFAEPMLGGAGTAVWSALTAEAAEIVHKNLAIRVFVFLRDGRIMAASDKGAIGSRIEVKGNPECPACDSTRAGDFPASAAVTLPSGAPGLRVISPIPVTDVCRFCHQKDDEARSYVAVDFDLTPLARARTERQRSILIMGLGSSVILVVLVTLLFRRLVMRPVEALMESMTRVAAGHLSARTKILGKDELALLGRHFNHMAERIEDQVDRIETAHTESELLYRLVVEASKSLETSEVATGVARVIMERLSPRRVTFFLECADGGWICATRTMVGGGSVEYGEGFFEAEIALDSGRFRKLLQGVPRQLVEEACRVQALRDLREDSELTVMLPVVSESRLLGLLACIGIPASVRVDDALLNNLGAHLNLAAVNSRNYTGAITDSLTGLKNKRYGMVRLEEALSFARRHRSRVGLALCDVDHFKQINDTYGHLAGDAVLKEISRRIASCMRKSDLVARYGGEEFLLILPEAPLDSLAAIGEKVRLAIEEAPMGLGPCAGTVSVTLSVGIAAFRADSDSGEILMARADAALYRAKKSGRNRVVIDAT
ncbi:MAG: diguanylate cyclase [Betaproteobacteria bacterium]|nr:diguanylate cyclase [Betaproteobacteria bacterium]